MGQDPTTELTPTQSERRARRRDEFLDAADAAIRAGGPGISMADVAAAGGVTKPVLYRFIADRDDLAGALAERYATQLNDVLDAGTAAAGDPKGMLDRTITAYLEFIESEPAIYAFLVQRAPVESPSAALQLSRFTHRLAGRITALLTEELARFGRSTDGAEAFAHGVIGMVEAAGDWWLARRLAGDPMTREDLSRHLVGVLWTGLAGLPSADLGPEGAAQPAPGSP